MKFWGISAVVCCLLADAFIGQHVYINHRPAYAISTNRTELVISWNNQLLVHGVASNMQAVVSPDGQSVAWVIQKSFKHPGFPNEQEEEATPYGVLFSAHNGQKPVEVLAPQQSRGMEFAWEFRSYFMTWHPHDLRWDSTSRYLYFGTALAVTTGAYWQLKPGDSNPRLVDTGGDYGLIKRWLGPDNVVVQGLRYELPGFLKDYDHWYLYTADDIARPVFVQSEKRVHLPVKDVSKST